MKTFQAKDYSSVADAVSAIRVAGGGKLVFSAGEYEAATVRLPSNIHLHFEDGAILKAAERGYDESEQTPWTDYQDFGHSHFKNSMLIADGVENVSFSGNGIISGEGHLPDGNNASGGIGNKLLVFKECRKVSIHGLHLRDGGHFTILANDVDGLELSNIRVQGTRDGANIIGCKNVNVRGSFFSGRDDALAFKSDFALGRVADTDKVVVRNCVLESNCNGIQFGTETVSAFRNMRFENIRCTKASKAGIGILSCDGAVIEDISFKNIILEQCTTFFFIKIADRGRRPDYRKRIDTGVIRRLSFENVEGRGPMKTRDMSVTPTIMGMPHRKIEEIHFKNVHLTVPGGRPAVDAGSYIEDTGFFRTRFATDIHPSYGWWMRDVSNVTFEDCSVAFSEPDGRPGIVVEDGENITFHNIKADRSPDQDYDVRLAGKSSACILDSDGIIMVSPDAHENYAFDLKHNTFAGYRAEEVNFSQVPFWFWNDELTMDEITRQINDFETHGVHAFVIHPRAGLSRHQSWMSAEWLEMVRFAVDHAAGRGMWVLLYDEAMYPSGSSGGQVVAENPAYACRGLVQVDLTEAQPGDIVQRVKVGENGVELADNQTLLADVRRQHDGHRIAIVDLPIGSTIRGVHFVDDDPPRRGDQKEVAENHPPAGDLLNPAAMQCFIRLVYQKYYDELSGHFGSAIKGFFTDEPHVMGRGHYPGLDPRPGTTGILNHVNAFLGYDFAPHLPALWDDSEPDAETHRENYRRAIHHRMQETYYRPISDWCQAHGVALTGHPAASDDIGLLRYFHIPGQDVVWHYIEPNKPSALEGPHSTMAKCASSAMLHAGRRRNLNEFAGAYGHGLTYETYRWLALWLLVRGCNMLVPHAFYYSIRGPRIDERPRDVGPNSPWWDAYKSFAAMTGKLCWLNTDSEHLCEVAILGQHDRLPWEAARICFENQVDFNYLEERHLLNNSIISAEGIHVTDMMYSTLIIEEGFETTLDIEPVLNQLEQNGRLFRWRKQEGPEQLLSRLPSSVTVTPPHAGLRVRRVRKDDTAYAIVFNESSEVFEGRLTLTDIHSGNLINMDTADGKEWVTDNTVTLAPHDCVVLVDRWRR